MRTSNKQLLAIVCAAIFLTACATEKNPRVFFDAVADTDEHFLYEGLPHPGSEPNELASERQQKQVIELHDELFYTQPLNNASDDYAHLIRLLAKPGTLTPFTVEKKCGGFHADFAIEWRRGGDKFLALLCFGCSEVKLFGPEIESRHELAAQVTTEMKTLLSRYRKNRPKTEKYDQTFAIP